MTPDQLERLARLHDEARKLGRDMMAAGEAPPSPTK